MHIPLDDALASCCGRTPVWLCVLVEPRWEKLFVSATGVPVDLLLRIQMRTGVLQATLKLVESFFNHCESKIGWNGGSSYTNKMFPVGGSTFSVKLATAALSNEVQIS